MKIHAGTDLKNLQRYFRYRCEQIQILKTNGAKHPNGGSPKLDYRQAIEIARQSLACPATVSVLILHIAMAALSPITLTEINSAAAEALKLIPGEEAAGLVTVVCGYTELAAMNPSNGVYIERLFEAVCKLSEFVMERGRHILARRLLLLANDIKRSSSGMSQPA